MEARVSKTSMLSISETVWGVRRNISYSVEAVDSEGGVGLLDLLGSGLGEGSDGVHSGVLGESKRDGLEGLGEGSDGVLLDSGHLKSDQ